MHGALWRSEDNFVEFILYYHLYVGSVSYMGPV